MFADTNSYRVTPKDLLEVVMDLLDQIKLASQVKILRCDCITFLDFVFSLIIISLTIFCLWKYDLVYCVFLV